MFLRLRFIDLAFSPLRLFFSFFLIFLLPARRPDGTMSPRLSLSVPKYFHQGDRRRTPRRMQACTSSILPIRVFTRVYTVRNTVSMTFARESRARSSIPFVTACVKENAGGHIRARMCPLLSRKRCSIISGSRSQKESHAIESARICGGFVPIQFNHCAS